jgi:lipoate-protein ligase A
LPGSARRLWAAITIAAIIIAAIIVAAITMTEEDAGKSTAYPLATWHLLLSAPADGATNMAVDEALLLSVAAGQAPPTLRFYAWVPPCLSLGYAQPLADVDLARLKARQWGLVRRPTGGRAILHTDELTYSVVAPMSEPRVLGGVVESYRRLSAGLVRGLDLLSLPVQADREYRLPGRDAKGAVCFETPSNYEITVGEKKLLGSAQTRKQGVVLQHGALPLGGDIARICDVLRFDSADERHQARERVLQRATTVAVCGRAVTWDQAAEALARGFAEMLNVSLERVELTPAQAERAARLRTEKYANAQWNERV